MIPQFEGLTEAEKKLMYDSIPLIAVYIAGADGKIDKSEIEWAGKITKIRSFSYHEDLKGFYADLSETYSVKLEGFIASLPNEVDARTVAIEEKLAGINAILAKLDINFAARFYKTLLSFAKHVAKASGGIFGFGSISRSEEALLGLDFINPVVVDEVEEEDDEL
jgi:hypothetical protein